MEQNTHQDSPVPVQSSILEEYLPARARNTAVEITNRFPVLAEEPFGASNKSDEPVYTSRDTQDYCQVILEATPPDISAELSKLLWTWPLISHLLLCVRLLQSHIFVIFSSLCITAVSGRFFFNEFNVLYFGAVGDGCTDDSQAFLKAWEFACNSEVSASVIIPEGKTFLVHPTSFNGPCKPPRITFQIMGTIVSPKATEIWKECDSTQWLAFRSVSGLIVDGTGTINGQGKNWWNQSCRKHFWKGCTTIAPTAVKFVSCQSCYLGNVHFIDSPNTHISIQKSEWFRVTNVRIGAPKTSPNTDGIHIERSKHIFIDHTTIQSGDDCISIGDHTSDIWISNINCGPGHGISVGSLGKGGSSVEVEGIHVSNVNFYRTTNGVRIKTWKGASGYARDITFMHLNFTAVQNPIIIDQYYCNQLYPGHCKASEKSEGGVQISNVTYRNATGSSSTKEAITLNCSQSTACTGILLDSIQLWSSLHRHGHQHERVTSSCNNARGRTLGVIQPNIPCLVLE